MNIADISRAHAYIQSQLDKAPTIGLVLGSGLGSFTKCMGEHVRIPYAHIPGFHPTSVPGHEGALVFGRVGKHNVLAMSGRYHFYEGYSMEQIAFPIAVMKQLGVKTLIVTNAAGGINTDFEVGDLMLINDHIKLVFDSPLRGPHNEELGPRFSDMTFAYSKRLGDLTLELAYGMGISMREGVYAYMPGPSFETPAEIRALRALGADAVGMSTVPEVIAAANYGIEVLGISLITNMAAGVLNQPLSHDEVIATGNAATKRFTALIGAIIGRIP